MLTPETDLHDVEALAARLTGDVVAPTDAAFDEARTGFILTADLRPDLVALPETAEDVVAIVEFARAAGLKVVPQGTGHNCAPLGSDLSEAILLKTSRMRAVTVDPAARVARAEAGAWWIDVTTAAHEHGLVALAGSSPDVGVVGYTLGGGVSWMVRKHGLSANHVVAIELVTADGTLRRVDATHEPELFWALRGGGGSFGVVTAIEVALFEEPQLYAGFMLFPVERASEVLRTWRGLVRTLPEEATSIGSILHVPDMDGVPDMVRGRSFARVELVYTGAEADGAALLAPLRALGPEIDAFGMSDGLGLARLHMDPEGAVPGTMSDHLVLSDDLDDDGIDAMVAVAAQPGSPLVMYELRHVGGAAARAADGHGAIDVLPGEFLAFGIGIPAVPELAAAIPAHLGRIRDAFATYDTQRAFSSFVERATDTRSMFSATTYARLAAVRADVDPERMFVANHPVG